MEKNGVGPRKKSVARLVACQALFTYYDRNSSDRNIKSILKSIGEYYIEDSFYGKYSRIIRNYLDRSDFIVNLLEGVIANVEELDSMISNFLHKPLTLETLDGVVLQSLRLASFELKNYPKTDVGVIVSEYVDIVSEFYGGAYTAFTNGILDKMGKYLRENSKNWEQLRKN
ncbi:MAG: transcription antitermination protein NusB [Rickettsiales bacterium]|jgi:transcription antitermination factor NusB|nr:transcription antitermination protein NusB [Rickettsiales bacterium]